MIAFTGSDAPVLKDGGRLTKLRPWASRKGLQCTLGPYFVPLSSKRFVYHIVVAVRMCGGMNQGDRRSDQ